MTWRRPRIAARAALLALGSVLAGPALAHPDIAITVRLLFDLDRGVLTGLGQSWTMDAAYSGRLLERFDRNRDGRFDPAETEAMREQLVGDFGPRQFFTALTLEDRPAARLEPAGFHADSRDGIVTTTFAFRVAAPVDLAGRSLAVEIADRDYTAAFRLAAEAGVQVRGDLDGHCGVSLNDRPDHAYFAGLVVPRQITLSCTAPSRDP